MDFGKICMDIFRQYIWICSSFCLWLMDLIYGIMISLAKLDLGDFNFIWGWFKGLLSLLAFFIIVRLVIHYFKATLNDDEVEKVDPIGLVKRIVLLALVLILLPSVMTSFSELSSDLTANIGTIVTGVDQDGINKPSNIIIATGYDGDLAKFDIDSININEQANGQYVLYPKSSDIILVLAMSLVSCYLLAFIAIQVAQRIVGLLLKILIGPFALSGIVDPSDNTMGLWFKLCVADFLTGFFQILLVVVALTATTQLPVGVISKGFFFVGALLAVMNAPAGIAQLLGGDVGIGTAFQQMQSLMMLGQGMQMTGGVIKTGLALAAYGAGRAGGGRSMLNNIGRGSDSGAGGSSGCGGLSALGGSSGETSPSVSEPSSSYGTSGADSSVGNAGDASGGYSEIGSFWNNVAQGFNQNPYGRMAVRAGTSIYRSSATRLGRSRTARSGNTVYQRNSTAVQAAHVVHGIADAFNGAGS